MGGPNISRVVFQDQSMVTHTSRWMYRFRYNHWSAVSHSKACLFHKCHTVFGLLIWPCCGGKQRCDWITSECLSKLKRSPLESLEMEEVPWRYLWPSARADVTRWILWLLFDFLHAGSFESSLKFLLSNGGRMAVNPFSVSHHMHICMTLVEIQFWCKRVDTTSTNRFSFFHHGACLTIKHVYFGCVL